ncbi:MAG: AIR synthase related protein, partial [Candidatus Diapherotrites archaeon]|nr:AIR synthase related protein [Candidatus Diapherotrites archaeon]
MRYSDIVDYSKLDPVKRQAITQFGPLMENVAQKGVRILPETLGEPAIAIEISGSDFLIAFNVEGLGTKNLIAEQMATDPRGKGVQYFEDIGVDTLAMATNDLSAIGAEPIVYGDILSSGDSNYFASEEKTAALLGGFKTAAAELNMAIPCGETPTLSGVVYPHTLDMAGAAVGLIRPKSNLTVGQQLQSGDVLIGLASSGVHANGISLIRHIAEKLPKGYFTELPQSGKVLGEELLIPTRLYSNVLMDLLSACEVHYLQPITGHGWKKIMRHKKSFSYEIDFVPPAGELFEFLQQQAGLPDSEAYYTWNMGVGYVAYIPKESV